MEFDINIRYVRPDEPPTKVLSGSACDLVLLDFVDFLAVGDARIGMAGFYPRDAVRTETGIEHVKKWIDDAHRLEADHLFPGIVVLTLREMYSREVQKELAEVGAVVWPVSRDQRLESGEQKVRYLKNELQKHFSGLQPNEGTKAEGRDVWKAWLEHDGLPEQPPDKSTVAAARKLFANPPFQLDQSELDQLIRYTQIPADKRND